MVRVLFVCTGNICRSPTAEGVFRQHVAQAGLEGRIEIASAGTHDYHVGEPPDARSVAHAARRGYDLTALRARQVSRADFHEFDRILAMDRGHLRQLQAIAPAGSPSRLAMFLDHSGNWRGQDVPDPYYGGARGFEEVLDMVEEAAAGLLEEIVAGLDR